MSSEGEQEREQPDGLFGVSPAVFPKLSLAIFHFQSVFAQLPCPGNSCDLVRRVLVHWGWTENLRALAGEIEMSRCLAPNETLWAQQVSIPDIT